MKRKARNLICVTLTVLSLPVLYSYSHAQSKDFSSGNEQIIQVSNTRIGPYRALALLTLRALDKGDRATALTLVEILNRSWNNSEADHVDGWLKTKPELWKKIDSAMDVFVDLVRAGDVDNARIEGACQRYLDELKSAE